MTLRGTRLFSLSALVLVSASIAGCAHSAEPVGPVDEGPLASASQAADTDTDPPATRDSDCDVLSYWTTDTSVIYPGFDGQGSSPFLEDGMCIAGTYSVFDPFEPGLGSSDTYNAAEASEFCGNVGGSGALSFFSNPGDGCQHYSNYPSPGKRRWVSYFGCCKPTAANKIQTVNLTKTNRDCNANVLGPMLPDVFGYVTFNRSVSGTISATVVLQRAAPNTLYDVRLIQTPNGGTCSNIDKSFTTDARGDASVSISQPLAASTHDAFVAINNHANFNNLFYSDEVLF